MLRLGALLAAGEAPGEVSARCLGFSFPGMDRQTNTCADLGLWGPTGGPWCGIT